MAGNVELTGQNVPCTIFVGGSSFGDDIILSMSVKEVATRFRDQHLGNKRAKTDKQVDGFDCSLEMHVADNKLIDALLLQNEARDNRTTIPSISICFTLEQRDGQDKTYQLYGVTCEFNFNSSGRESRVKMTLDCQAEDLKKIQG